MPPDTDPTARIVSFLRGIGMTVSTGDVADDAFLPGIAVRGGGIVYDPTRLAWPGDLLHEAGHIAVTDPALRPTLHAVRDDPTEEMATIAWSYAAAVAIDVPTDVVFHDGGYMGGGGWLREAFVTGATIGQPMLSYWGMCEDPARAASGSRKGYPHMNRWLR